MSRRYAVTFRLFMPLFSIFHPLRVRGKENIPAGPVMICANHTGMSDPLLIIHAFGSSDPLRVMAKDELMRIPILGRILKSYGIFGVKRGQTDVKAVKTALKALKDGEKLLVFPEGTRHQDGVAGEAKAGAAMIAMRAGVPILPVYVPAKKPLFHRTEIFIGTPFRPAFAGSRPTQEEYRAAAEEIMSRIMALREDI